MRVFSGILIFIVAMTLYFIDSFFINFIILASILYLSFEESLKLFNIKERNNLVFLALFAFFISIFANPVMLGLLVIIGMASVIAYNKTDDMKTILPFIYPSLPFFVILNLYQEYGINYLAWLVFCVSACDIGAYYVGKKFGNKQFSLSSPNKSIQGVLGGIICGTFFGFLIGFILIDEKFIASILISFVVAVVSIFGDLFESYLKRRVNIKDTSNLIPGHGGVLDRIDAYLFAVIAFSWALSW